MIKGKCIICEKRKFLTKHSLMGHHTPPFIKICKECHNEIHGIIEKPKQNKKYMKGTKKSHKKK